MTRATPTSSFPDANSRTAGAFPRARWTVFFGATPTCYRPFGSDAPSG